MLEDDDIAKLADAASAKDHEYAKRSIGEYVAEISKSHGKLGCTDSTLRGGQLLLLLFFNNFFLCLQITLKGHSTRSW